MSPSESRQPKGTATGGWRRRLWASLLVILSTICLTTTTALSHRRVPTNYRWRHLNQYPGTTTITWPENPLPPTGDEEVEEPLPPTTSPAPADTLHSPSLNSYPPVTPSISSSSQATQGKAIVRPHRRILRNQQLLTRRTHNTRNSWRGDTGGGSLLKWPLQALEEVDAPRKGVEDDRTLHWWVTNEPQLTLAAPETTINQMPNNFQQIPRTTRIMNWETPHQEDPIIQNHLDIPRDEGLTPRPPRTTPPASSPTIHPPFSSPTTLAEDPAVLQAPQELISDIELRQPRWFPLDRLFRMITVGADGECVGGEGRIGVCMLEGACRNAGGTPSSSCIFGYGNCCIEYKATCGLEVRTNRTYWVSPLADKDSVVNRGGSCVLRVFKTSSNICHIRLDMRNFKLVGPQQGSCLRDRLIVSGHNINAFIPKVCGENSGQHMYIDVDTVSGPIELNINTVGEGLTRSWDIEVSQISCNSPQRPPANCLQYYTGPQGIVSSFNYLPNPNSQYLNNLNYAICLRKEAGFCSVVYSDKMKGTVQDFEIVNFRIGPTGLATSVVPVGEAGVGLILCPDDYLVMAGTRLCGDRFNDGSTDPQPTNSGPVTDSTNGPFTVQVITNGQNTGLGFRLQYQQYPC